MDQIRLLKHTTHKSNNNHKVCQNGEQKENRFIHQLHPPEPANKVPNRPKKKYKKKIYKTS